MRKFLSFLMATLFSVTMFAAQGGSLSSNPSAPIDPTAEVTLTYDGTSTNFNNWKPTCYIHAWLEAAEGKSFSKSYSTQWVDCNGDEDYAAIAANRKMTFVSQGVYSIKITVKTFFDVAEADLDKIGKLGVIVCSQYNGQPNNEDNNKTNNMYLSVSYTPAGGGEEPPVIVKETLRLVPGESWNKDGAKFAAYYWGAELAEAAWTSFFAGKGDTLSAEINAVADSMVLVRFNSALEAPTWDNEKDNVWGKIDKIAIDHKSLVYTITSYTTGQWDTYIPEVPAKYYVTGDSALVVDAGLDAKKAWDPKALKSEKDTLELTLKAGQSYALKAVVGESWLGYNALSKKPEGVTGDASDNICFSLSKETKLQVVCYVKDDKTTFELTGDFYVAPAAPECQDGPYAVLVNGTDTLASVKGDEFDGYTQYVVYASLTKGDSIQLLNESCGELWMSAIEEGGAGAHLTKGLNAATIDSTGCYDLYIKMKSGADKLYIGYGICADDTVPAAPECQDGPYAVLVNGTDTLASVKGDEFDGYTQYVVYASLTKGDSIQLLNESCGALWMSAIEEGGAGAHLTKGLNAATIDSTGCYDLYIKMKSGADKLYIGYGICPNDTVPAAPECQDGPYAVLVNGTDTLASVKGDELDGYTQYVVYASLTKGDSIQLLNESCGALWMSAIEEGGAGAHLTKGLNAATIDSTGCYDLYIKMKSGADKLYIGYGICPNDTVPAAPECQDGPYAVLVNGTDTLASVKGDEFDGYTQYVVYASLTKGDSIQLLNESCGALWMSAIEEGGAGAHLTKGLNAATIDSTGCYDLYIKMKSGADKLYIGYGICADDTVPAAPECQDGPYAVLVNGTDTLASVKGDEFDGYTQYVVYASLTKGDSIQLLNESCGALWMSAIEEGGAGAHLTKGLNAATIDSTGCYDLYIKMKSGADKLYIGYGICADDTVPAAPECQDGPYAVLVNGTDTLASVKGDEFDGYTQYVVYASLTKGDSIQLLNESCGALWMSAIEEGGAGAHLTKGLNAATIDSTGCYDLYIKMKSGADKLYIGYGICPNDTVPAAPECQDGPYAVLVNGTDTLASVKGDEFDGYTQYVVYASLTKGDSIQLLNESCGALWMSAIEEGGAGAHLTKGLNAATIDSTGCYDLYIKMKSGADKLYIGYGICPDDTVPAAPECQDGPYALIINGTVTMNAVAMEAADYQGRKQYKVDSVELKVNDKLVVANLSCDAKWTIALEQAGAAANFEMSETEYTVKTAGLYAFYIKMSMEVGDLMYVEEIKEPVVPPTVENGFYLVGTMNNWTADEAYAFQPNEKADGEYLLSTTLTVGDELKVAYVENGQNKEWYPGMDTPNFTVDADHAGKVVIYFRPDYQGGDEWYYHTFFVAVESSTGLDTLTTGKAVKVLRNGQLIIQKNGKQYNAQGILIR